jgi:hypothetical protein
MAVGFVEIDDDTRGRTLLEELEGLTWEAATGRIQRSASCLLAAETALE